MDGSDIKSDGNMDNKDVCRDFLKGMCNRGQKCKFYHPPKEDGDEINEGKEEFVFCNDFQNPKGCQRGNCRYVHANREDVNLYHKMGEVTLPLACAIAAVTEKSSINGIPFCKEFKMGRCERGPRCRYWHVDPDTEHENRYGPSDNGMKRKMPNGPAPPGYNSGPPPMQPMYGGNMNYGMNNAPYEMKRPRYDMGGNGGMGPPMMQSPMQSMGGDPRVIELEKQLVELKKENASLQRELHRERERYEDLYALFRQHQSQTGAVPVGGVPQPQPVSAPQMPGGPMTVSGAPVSLAIVQPQHSIHSSTTNAHDVAVHWSTVQMHR